jgi:hypothetical protein
MHPTNPVDFALAAQATSYERQLAEQAEYIELLENQVIVAMTVDEPVPFLPVDPEEQRRRDVQASDGEQCMIYRSNP